jgi:hypothetical protein
MDSRAIDMTAYPAGFDVSWLAIDSLGQVGLFVTAGSGPIPSSAMPSIMAELSIEEMLDNLPVQSAVRRFLDDKSVESFLPLARRGVFVFDWSDIHRTHEQALDAYELLCMPLAPLHVTQLPHDLRQIALATEAHRSVFKEFSCARVQGNELEILSRNFARSSQA